MASPLTAHSQQNSPNPGTGGAGQASRGPGVRRREQAGPAGVPAPCRSLARVFQTAWRSAPTARPGRRGGRPETHAGAQLLRGRGAGSEGKGGAALRGESEEAACRLPGPSAPRWPVGGWVGGDSGGLSRGSGPEPGARVGGPPGR